MSLPTHTIRVKARPSLLYLLGLGLLFFLAGEIRAQEPPAPRQYAPLQTPTWRLETVDGAETGAYNSLALDSSGWPQISYQDYVNDDLKYAYKSASGWHTQTVDSAGYVGAYTSLKLDSADHPHISYCSCTGQSCATCNALKYAWHDGSAWHIESVDTTGNVGGYTSLALDADQPNISYYDFTNGDLKYAYKDASGWHATTLDSAGDVGRFTSLAIGWGQRHISYMDYGNYDLKYAHYDGSTWHIETLDSSGYVGYFSSLAFCMSAQPGAPRIVYNANDTLRYAHKLIFSGWISATLSNDSPAGLSLALNRDCQQHISYFDWYRGDLKYIYNDVSGWHTETVDDHGDAGAWWSSLALDSADGPHISYYDVNMGALRYAYKVYTVYLPLVMRN